MITKYVDFDSYIVRFRTSIVPPSVIYMGKRLTLRPYIQKVRRCDKCQRFGHIAKICRTTDINAICVRCGKHSSSHNGDDKSKYTSDKPSCINCLRHKLKDGEHEASWFKCPIFLQQKEIKRIMAYRGASFSEAVNIMHNSADKLDNCSVNSFAAPLPTLFDFLPSNLASPYKNSR